MVISEVLDLTLHSLDFVLRMGVFSLVGRQHGISYLKFSMSYLMITSEWESAIRIEGRNGGHRGPLLLLLGCHGAPRIDKIKCEVIADWRFLRWISQ